MTQIYASTIKTCWGNFSNHTKITFDAVGESATLIYHDSEWNIISLNGATTST